MCSLQMKYNDLESILDSVCSVGSVRFSRPVRLVLTDIVKLELSASQVFNLPTSSHCDGSMSIL